MDNFSLFGLGAVAGYTIFLGLPLARFATSRKLNAFLNTLSVGILLFLFVEIVHALVESVEGAMKGAVAGQGLSFAVQSLLVVFLGWAVSLFGLNWFEERYLRVQGSRTEHQRAKNLSMMIAVGIGLHNFGEGLAIGQQFSSGTSSLGWLLVTGFALHNATEGFGIAAPLGRQRPSWGFLALVGFVGGTPTFVGTMLGSRFSSPLMESCFLALASGSILYVIGELIHLGKIMDRELGSHRMSMAGLVVGFFLAFGSELLIETAPTYAAFRQPSKEYSVTLSEFRFTPSYLEVEFGKPMKLVLANIGQSAHEFEIQELGIEISVLPGKTVTTYLTPKKVGSFGIICDMPGHLMAGMRGNLVVKEMDITRP